jgi:hypothetical protein
MYSNKRLIKKRRSYREYFRNGDQYVCNIKDIPVLYSIFEEQGSREITLHITQSITINNQVKLKYFVLFPKTVTKINNSIINGKLAMIYPIKIQNYEKDNDFIKIESMIDNKSNFVELDINKNITFTNKLILLQRKCLQYIYRPNGRYYQEFEKEFYDKCKRFGILLYNS